MKHFYSVLSAFVLFTVSLSLVSCKKQIAEPEAIQPPSSMAVSSTACKPSVLAFDNGQWVTLLQKWYSDDGKVKNLKARSPRLTGIFAEIDLEMIFDVDWAEVSYQGNQVDLTDVQNKNNLHMRVTLDDRGRPVATYYYNHPHPEASPQFWNDTTYYYYNGDRLDYIISLYTTNGYGSPAASFYRRYDFSYDSHGDLIQARRTGPVDINFHYDYTKPVQGIIFDYQITSSLTLLEYLDLIKMPMHYAVSRVEVGPGNSTQFNDYVITDGLVRSYVSSGWFLPTTIYNGWDCGTNISSASGTEIVNRQQFQQLFPVSSH